MPRGYPGRQHGIYSTYTNGGCRCDACKAVAASYRVGRGQRWKAEYGETQNNKRRGTHRRDHVNRYGIDVDDYNLMRLVQGDVCAICGSDDSGRPGTRMCIDHDRETGRIRGLLCHRCNTAIGLLQHNADNLRRALDYIEEHTLATFGRPS